MPAASPDPYATAVEIDRLLLLEAPPVLAEADDETFVRRTYLDLVGRPATRNAIMSFCADESSNKRRELVTRLLNDPDFGENWGKFWRDVIMYRRSEQRAMNIAGTHLSDFLAKEFNNNKPWNHSVTEMITASGFTNESGQGGFIVAQGGLPENIAAEVSRVFLGIQIECAQCHDHPSGTWKREQFHHFAAFFPRVGAQLHREKIVFLVTTIDRELRRRPEGNARFFGTLEHYMPDLREPGATGMQMEPVYYLTGQKLPLGKLDADRRSTIAGWITDPANPQFAKAFVNRIWTELIGSSFFLPVDDLGPQTPIAAPQTLDYLSHAFIESGYDVKWFFSTVTATTAYQRRNSNVAPTSEGMSLASCTQRLRADQLFDSLVTVLKLDDDVREAYVNSSPVSRRRASRTQFNEVFGFDPSLPRQDVVVTIPQSLLLINSSMVNAAVSARRRDVLGGILSRNKDDAAAVVELYLRTLGRKPADSETKTCLEYVPTVNNRNEAFEDIFWALINSTEFPHRM